MIFLKCRQTEQQRLEFLQRKTDIPPQRCLRTSFHLIFLVQCLKDVPVVIASPLLLVFSRAAHSTLIAAGLSKV